MRFQGLAVVLGKQRWRELVAHPRKNDLGLDAYAPASETPESVGKGLAASITATRTKISADAKTAKEHYPDLQKLLFVTPARIVKARQREWEEAIRNNHHLELIIIEREEIITLMMMPHNASLSARFLHLDIDSEPGIAELIERTRRAAATVSATWARRIGEHPIIPLPIVRLAPNGAESTDQLSFEGVGRLLSDSSRVVLEGPGGCGKTTTLIQLAQRVPTVGTPLMVDLPAWASSRQGILDYIAGMPPFQTEGVTATLLARVHQSEPFVMLLNGWNEITPSDSERANAALQELERDFPSTGIIVATRTHHLRPPLPGAVRLRVLRLRRQQRTAYLIDRLGTTGAELLARIDADPSLDELTRTPFTLSAVASLFEADTAIPSTKIAVLANVLNLREQRGEHRNALHAAPMFGRHTDYLRALATEMTHRGAVALPVANARAVVANVARELVNSGQVEPVGAPTALATLTAHHVLELLDYPEPNIRFEHQQLQEYFAALNVHAQLLALPDEDPNATDRFTANYVNEPSWAEPLRMIAETLAEQIGNGAADERNTRAGTKLVQVALAVDPVFAGELAQRCGSTVWNEVRAMVCDRLRTIYAIPNGTNQQYALAAMLATGAEDFRDIIEPLLSDEDQQARLTAYRLWRDIRVSSLGSNWRERVRGWSDEARADFVSELLHHRIDDEVADFAAEDESIAVKKAAVSALMWNRSDHLLARVLESMDAQPFADVARENADLLPEALRSQAVAAMRSFIENSPDHPQRLRTALDLIELGETDLDGVIRDAMAALPAGDMRNLGPHYLQPALEHLRNTDPVWASEWVAIQLAEGGLYGHEYWLPFATAIPEHVTEKYMQRLETEDLTNAHLADMMAVIAVRADIGIAARAINKLRELRRKVDAEPEQRHPYEHQVMRQLESLFRCLPDDVAAAAIISNVTDGDPLDIKVAAALLSRVAKREVEPLRVADDRLKTRLREYLTGSVELLLRDDDFAGVEKANLSSSIAQVGEAEDMHHLLALVRADIDRMRRVRAAAMAGDRGPLLAGGRMSYAGWHIAALMHLDATVAEQVVIDLLNESEYRTDAAAAMAQQYVTRSERPFGMLLPYDLIWAARQRTPPTSGEAPTRARFAGALRAEINRLREQNPEAQSATHMKQLAAALAAVDGRDSAAEVLDVIAVPGHYDEHTRLDAAERLLIAGVDLPSTKAFALADSILERTERWGHDADRYLLRRTLALCLFVDDPAAGIAKVHDTLRSHPLRGHQLRDLVRALGESRSDAAVDLLSELAADAQTFEQCEDNFFNAFASLDTPRSRDLLLAFVDPGIHGIPITRQPQREDVLVARLTELAQRGPEAAARLQHLCERKLPNFNRCVVSKVMDWLGTPEALAANLNLISDAHSSPVPRGVWNQLERTFVEQRPYGQDPNVYTQHARASNESRRRLFHMALHDPDRRESASMLLGEIEVWRLDYGRPTGEPRHPDLASGQPWPPLAPR